jgi:hypothetical protein
MYRLLLRDRQRVQVARTPARWINFYFFTARAALARSQVFIFLPRAACTVEIMFYFCRAAAARCWILICPPRRACAAVDLTGRHRAEPTRRTDVRGLPRRSGHEICFLI